MYYYNIAIVGSPLEPLTYHAENRLLQFHEVSIALGKRHVCGVVLETVHKPQFDTSAILQSTGRHYSQIQVDTAFFLSNYYCCSIGEAFAIFLAYKIGHEAVTDFGKQDDNKLHLSYLQSNAFEFLKRHLVSLLFGDTGSGKTEIYMKYFESVISEGKQALFLMPEISLTPQMQMRLETHFGEGVVMWHSKLTKLQKERALEKIYNGTATVIAGPRSALFLPLERLGVIVVDEEHDDSYKSSSRPRYNARDMAIYIGTQNKIPVVLGSATPSLTSYVKFPHFRLKGGHYASTRHIRFEAHGEAITPAIEVEVRRTLERKEQTIVFIPTRANFKYLSCQGCGYTLECPYCSVGMSLHRQSGIVRCHYCNYAERIPQQCPKCGATELISSRIGTAEAVEHFRNVFPEARIEQFDRDVITTQKKLKEALARFNDKQTDILVGTQMLSKGHDYHDVTLAVVLGLDNVLNLGDYRAREKALSLLIQIAGRSGRKKEATVLVQSFNEPFFKAYLGSYERFLDEEKEYRKGMYPPYKKLCRLLFAHKNGAKARDAMEKTAEALRRVGTIEVIGSGPSAIERIAGKYRFQILLRADRSTDLIRAVRGCADPMAEIDMDPVEFH